MSSNWRKRFAGIDEKTVVLMLKELEEAITDKGKKLLTSEEMHELICLLPRDYFRNLFRLRLREIKLEQEPFMERLKDFNGGVKAFTMAVTEALDGEDAMFREEILTQMDDLWLYHPAMWYKVYKKITAQNVNWAVELVPIDTERPFLTP